MKQEFSRFDYLTAKKWSMYDVPQRPSKQELKIIKNLLKKLSGKLIKKRLNILVLGSTPEYRKLLSKFRNINVTCVDFSSAMYRGMTAAIGYKPKREILVEENWVDINFHNKFDLVLGHLVLGNVPHKYQKQFLKNIKNTLKPNACFITRDSRITNEFLKSKLDLSEFMKAYATKKPLKLYATLFYSYCIFEVLKNNNFVYTTKDVIKVINKAYRKIKSKDKKIKSFYEYVTGFTENAKYTWYDMLFEDKINLLKEFFKIQTIYFPDNHDLYDLVPLFILKRSNTSDSNINQK